MIDPFLQEAGKGRISLHPIGKLIENQELRKSFASQEPKELIPRLRHHVAKDRKGSPDLFDQMEKLLLGGSLHGLVVEAAKALNGLLEEGGLANATAARDVPKYSSAQVTTNLSQLVCSVPKERHTIILHDEHYVCQT